MDTFFEQIVYSGRSGKKTALIILIWLLCIALSVGAFWFFGLMPLSIIIIAGIIYGAYKLSTLFYIEYEYIITNGSFDIDKITAKSSRKRVISFELSEVDNLEKYNPAAKDNCDAKLITCNENDPGAYKMTVVGKENKKTVIVFAPDERIKQAMSKFLPRFVSNSAFK